MRRRGVCQSNLPCARTFFWQYRDAQTPCQLCCFRQCTCSDMIVSFARKMPCQKGTFNDRGRDALPTRKAVRFLHELAKRYDAVCLSRTDDSGDAFCLPQASCQTTKRVLAPADEGKKPHTLCKIGGNCPAERTVCSIERDPRSHAVCFAHDALQSKRSREDTAIRKRMHKRARDILPYGFIGDDSADDALPLGFLQAKDSSLSSACARDVAIHL